MAVQRRGYAYGVLGMSGPNGPNQLNGKSPTAETIDGITIDANLISRRKFVQITSAIGKAVAEDDAVTRDELSGELVELIVKAWPFGTIISKDAYLDLGLIDSQRVDNAVSEFMRGLGEKKLELPSTLPESIASP